VPAVAPQAPASHLLRGDARTGWLAVHRDAAAALTRAGFDLDADGRVRAAAEAGRAALLELELVGVDGCAGPVLALLRRHQRGGLPARLRRSDFPDPTRPFDELALSERLRALGIDTPRVLAARARRTASGGFELALVTERVVGAVDLAAALARARGAARHDLVRAAARFVARLFDAGLVHADLHPKNLLVASVDGRHRLWVVDLDRAHLVARPPLDQARRRAQLARLLRWCLRRADALGYTRTDGRRFLDALGVADARSECRLISRRVARRLVWSRTARP